MPLTTEHRGDLSVLRPTLSEGKEPSSQTSIATGIHDDKARLYRGEATQITEHRDIGDIIRSLKAKGVEVVIENTAEEIPPASPPDTPS